MADSLKRLLSGEGEFLLCAELKPLLRTFQRWNQCGGGEKKIKKAANSQPFSDS